MTDDRDPKDELDPSDWLASQFGATEPVATPLVAPPAVAVPPAVVPPVLPPPAAVPPVLPPVVPPVASGAPFQWGLTPGGTPEPAPATPPPATPAQQPVPPLTPPPPAPQPEPVDPFATQAMPVYGQGLEALPVDPSRWASAPVDSALDGMTEVIEAEIVGLATPEGEGVEASAIDSLFGETQFKEYADELITAPPPRASGGGRGGAKPPAGPLAGARAAIPRNQKILLWVAGSVLAVLALVALFLVGTRLSAVLGPSPAIASPSPTPSPTLIVLPIGPVAPGEYQWDELLGGECVMPYESAWQDSYTVVDCAVPHPAQMVFRGTFADEANAAYPGFEELQKRINLLCTAPTVINYAVAGTATDIQVEASFAVDASDWDEGNRTFFCFVSRSAGSDLVGSVGIPQVPATPAPAG